MQKERKKELFYTRAEHSTKQIWAGWESRWKALPAPNVVIRIKFTAMLELRLHLQTFWFLSPSTEADADKSVQSY